MPINSKLLAGPKFRTSQIRNGAKVKLGSRFKTASGHDYPQGSEGVKKRNWRHGWLVEMNDGKTIKIPRHLTGIVPV